MEKCLSPEEMTALLASPSATPPSSTAAAATPSPAPTLSAEDRDRLEQSFEHMVGRKASREELDELIKAHGTDLLALQDAIRALPETQIRAMYQALVRRAPTPEELKAGVSLIRERGNDGAYAELRNLPEARIHLAYLTTHHRRPTPEETKEILREVSWRGLEKVLEGIHLRPDTTRGRMALTLETRLGRRATSAEIDAFTEIAARHGEEIASATIPVARYFETVARRAPTSEELTMLADHVRSRGVAWTGQTLERLAGAFESATGRAPRPNELAAPLAAASRCGIDDGLSAITQLPESRIRARYTRAMGAPPTPEHLAQMTERARTEGIDNILGAITREGQVRDAYRSLLGRQPTEREIAGWSGRMLAGDDLYAGIRGSEEYRNRPEVRILTEYTRAMGAPPTPEHLAQMTERARTEGLDNILGAITREGRVRDAFRAELGRQPTETEIAGWSGRLLAGQDVVAGIRESSEYHARRASAAPSPDDEELFPAPSRWDRLRNRVAGLAPSITVPRLTLPSIGIPSLGTPFAPAPARLTESQELPDPPPSDNPGRMRWTTYMHRTYLRPLIPVLYDVDK